ncbi:MAG: PAS domain-containing protein [Emcibacter sp.]|nr:PAS domain-containing protein [Emcibacter sp.]
MSTSDYVAQSQLMAVNQPQDIPVSLLRDLYEYWQGKKGDRKMPSRLDICPTEIIDLLPKIILIDVEYEPQRFRFRLVGTDVVRVMGQDATGKYLDELSSDSAVHDRLSWLIRQKTTYYVSSQLDWLNRSFQKYHVLGLPLGDEAGNVNMIMYGIDQFYDTGK